jgi:hypothetical protein
MLELIYIRLQSSPALAEVRLAESVAAIAKPATAAADGAVFVAPYRERANPPRNATGGHMQVVDVQFCTAIIAREHDDPQGAERARRIEERRESVEQLLTGWQPIEGSFSVALVGAEGSSLGNGVSIYVQTWQVSRFLTGAP